VLVIFYEELAAVLVAGVAKALDGLLAQKPFLIAEPRKRNP
jgi:hypothetical protein